MLARSWSLSSSTMLALLSLVVVSVGCGKSPKERLSGKWVGDRIENATPDQTAQALPWVKATTWELSGDKITISLPAEPPRSGAYKVTKIDGEKMKLAVARPDGQSIDEVTVALDGAKTMRWSISEERTVVFARAE